MKRYSLPKAAELIKISARQLQRYCERGTIGQRPEGGRHYSIGEDEIKAFIRAPKGRRPHSPR